ALMRRPPALPFASLVLLVTACSSGTSSDDGGFSTFSTMNSGDGDGETGDGDGDPSPDCGDGTVDAGEQCDLGPENSAAGQCTPDCQIATCGDGYVYEGFEECDDGNSTNTDD